MFVIRKRLFPNEGSDPNTRYDETCDCVQSTFDGGTTWNDNPNADPRTSPTFLNPAAADDKCAGAQGVSNFVRDFLEGAYQAFNVVGIASWAIQIGFFFTPLTIFWRIAMLVGEGLIEIGELTLQATFDEDTYDQIRDIAYCWLDDTGKFADQAAFDGFGAQLQEDIGGSTFNIVMALMFNLYGWVGFSNAAIKYAENADCSGAACIWCHHWTLSEGAVDNLGITFLGGSITANGAESAVFFGTSALLTVDFEWDALVVEDMSFSFFCSAGGNGGTRNWQVFNGATSVRSGNIGQGSGGATININDINVTTTRIRIQIHTSNNTAPNWVSDFVMSGNSSEQPFVENNC